MAKKKDLTFNLCSRCVSEEVPMIFTFRFDLHEWWCPRCGLLAELFDNNYITVPVTEELTKRNQEYLKQAKPFLSGDTDNYQYTKKY